MKIVVTDDAGRFAAAASDATYNVWVRGYGLVDSPKVKGRPGDAGLELKVQAAKDARGREGVSRRLLAVAARSARCQQFSRHRRRGQRRQWVRARHTLAGRLDAPFQEGLQLATSSANQLTRTLTHMDAEKLGFKSHEDAWLYRTTLGVRGTNMAAAFLQFGGEGMAKTMADWTRSVESGAVPPAPPRPQGIERNVVVTLWDIGGPQGFHAR
ncbi:MAG: hypothetical protein IPM70_12935 [Proteobacteria bacterium]|nr:hypothetical protein [Pseudomonadota bacterium]